MTVTSLGHPFTVTDRREALVSLARAWDERPRGVRQLALRFYAADTLPGPCRGGTCGGCLSCWWDAFRHALSLLDGVREGCAELPEDYLGCADPWGEYGADLEMQVAGDLDALVNGTARWGRGAGN